LILTEQDAQTKVCRVTAAALLPAVQAPGSRIMAQPANPQMNYAFSNCLASKCMAWRWYGDERHGYCGLAGTPEAKPWQPPAPTL
jgi:hypothetical protein